MKGSQAILVLLFPFVCQAQGVELGQVVVTPRKTASLSRYHTVDMAVVSGSNVGQAESGTSGEALGSITGVDVVGGGRLGSNSQGLYIRGAQTKHTGYFFEGIKMYDPTNTSAYYVPSDFLTGGVDRIEVVKFPLSSLYGSSPLAGAVNFMLKRPQDKPYLEFSTLGGSHSTQANSLELGGKKNDFSYLFNVSRLDTDGISRARAKNNNPEKDAYQDTNFTLNLNYSKPQDIEVGLAARIIHARQEFDEDDNFDGIPEDDTDNLGWNNEAVSTIYLKKELAEFFAYKIQLGYTGNFRRYRDDTDEYVRSWYKGSTYQITNHFEITPADFYKLIIGFDYTQEKMDSYWYTYNYAYAMGLTSDFPKKTCWTKGIFLEQVLDFWDKISLDLSYRRENHPYFKSHDVFKTGLAVSVTDKTDLYFSFGQGFKAPSLYQLFSSSGNRDLKPEKSQSWETGFSYAFADWLSFSGTYFQTDIKHIIDYVYINPVTYLGRYMNAAKEKIRGFELKTKYEPVQWLTINAGYTYLNGEQDFVDDDFITIFRRALIRVPEDNFLFKAGFHKGKWSADFDLERVSQRIDRIWGWVDEFVTMKPYTLANISANYQLNENLDLLCKINNVFNVNYERIKGYQEETLSLYAGVKCRF